MNFFTKHVSREIPFAIGIPALVWQAVFFYIPLLLIIFSSLWSLSTEGIFQGLTLKNFINTWDYIYLKIVCNSLYLAVSTTILCLGLAFPLAYFIAFRAKKQKNLLLFFLMIPFWTNFLLHIYAWFFVLEKQGFLNTLLISLGMIDSPLHILNTPFATMLMMVYYFLPFMVLPIYSSMENIDRNLLEASLDLGAGWLQTVGKVLFPLSLSGIRSGILLVYIPAFGEFVIPELMGGDKQYFVGSVISQFVLGNHTAPLGAAFTVMSTSVLVLSLLAIFVVLRKLGEFFTRGIA
ncbi:MAG: ABC transporter permease [Chlamydiae bacterium]|nr:ABC transporter permease [Chlamydiota bacterium]